MTNKLDMAVVEAALYFASEAMEQFPGRYTPEASLRFNRELLKVRALRRGKLPPPLSREQAAPRVVGTLHPYDGSPALSGEFAVMEARSEAAAGGPLADELRELDRAGE